MSKFFSNKEMTCHCGCGLNCISADLMLHLDAIRDMVGHPLIMNSGCRCVKQNAKVGGVADSSHCPDLLGICHAVDIAAETSEVMYQIIRYAMIVGIPRVCVYHDKKIVHLDNCPVKAQNIFRVY